ncbi:MAG: CAP domain-containing protein [Sphingomonas sp.]
MLAHVRLAAALGACWIALVGAADQDSLESQVLERINYVRAHPHEYAERLRDDLGYFDGRILHLPGDPNGVITREGPGAVDEAIGFLEHQQPLPPLDAGDLLALAARDHVVEQAEGGIGHQSPDGASPGERVRRRGGDIYVGEVISYGPADADAAVRQFIVDDGVPGRGHRKLLFASDLRFAGVGCGAHPRYRHMCVVDLSGTPRGTPPLPDRAEAGEIQRATVSR